MKAIARSVWFFLLCLLFANHLTAQKSGLVDAIFGADPLLYNGKVYTFVMPAGTEGHPFFAAEEFTSGEIRLHGKHYPGQLINYDLFNQQLILHYVDMQGAEKRIIVSDAYLEGFSLNDKNFVLPPTADTALGFIQLIGNEMFGIAYAWSKTLALDAKVGSTNRVFSKAKRRSYVMQNGHLSAFRNKASFLKALPATERPGMKQLLKEYKIRLKRHDDAAIGLLVTAWQNHLNP